MNALAMLLLQSAHFGGPNPADDLPRFGEVEVVQGEKGHKNDAYPNWKNRRIVRSYIW